jgi:holin-like protein
MLFPITIVASFLIAGDVFVAASGLPVPGAVLGMLGLALVCTALPEATNGVSRLFDAIIPFAPMLFVPAAVGVIANVDALASAWLPIVSAVTLSTAASLLLTGVAFQILLLSSWRLIRE